MNSYLELISNNKFQMTNEGISAVPLPLAPMPSPRRPAYTLIEMLTTIAVLVILLGLMVSLARRVRAQSAESVTKSLLAKLDRIMSEYMSHNDDRPPRIEPFVSPDGKLIEPQLQRTALRNNRDVVRILKSQLDLSARDLNDLPIALYDEVTLRDAWGTPIVFMPSFNPALGTAPGDKPFFMSAGPDGRFLTRWDNLYSYEGPALRR
jgi:type II secretory pathway pseudopilin PulG